MNLYKDLKEESPEICKKEAHAILSKRTGFGISTVQKTLLEYERTGNVTSPNKKKPRITCNQKSTNVTEMQSEEKFINFT